MITRLLPDPGGITMVKRTCFLLRALRRAAAKHAIVYCVVEALYSMVAIAASTKSL